MHGQRGDGSVYKYEFWLILAIAGLRPPVLGCDGIHSRVRQLILGEDHLAAQPSYTHKYSLRGIVPMEQITALIGSDKPFHRTWHLGADAHAVTYPIRDGALLNVNAMVSDPAPWPNSIRTDVMALKVDAAAAFEGFGPTMRAIVSSLPEHIRKWALFDHADYPAPSYIGLGGRVCVLGDAAHTATPHLGAGASCAFEDVAVIANINMMAEETPTSTSPEYEDSIEMLCAALATYESVRYDRSQWLVKTSRRMGEVQQGQDREFGVDDKRRAEAIDEWYHRIWDYDIETMLCEASDEFTQRLQGLRRQKDARE